MKAYKVPEKENPVSYLQWWEIYDLGDFIGYAQTQLSANEKDAIKSYLISRQSDF